MKVKSWVMMLVLIVANYYFADMCLASPQNLSAIQGTEQVVYVYNVQGSKGLLELWERNEHGQWIQKGSNTSVIVGYNGAIAAEYKREGDGHTPKGTYTLGMAFGYEPLAGVQMPYKVLTEQDFWVDEPQSPAYNTLVSGRPQSGSYEVMRKADGQYSLGVVVEYNMRPVVPYKGSAIFLHVWRSPNAVTEGCIAMDTEQLRRLLLWLVPTKKPIIIIE